MKKSFFLSLAAFFLSLATGLFATAASAARAVERAADAVFSPSANSQAGRLFLNLRIMFTSGLERLYGAYLAPVIAYALASVSPHAALTGQTPNRATFEKYRVTDRNSSEIVGQPLFDWQLYPAAGQQEFTFFINPIGQGMTSTPGAVVGSAKLPSDTNMRGAGQLPSGMEFMIESLEVYFLPGSVSTANTYTPAKMTTDATGALLAASVSAVNDVSQFYNEGTLSMLVLQKPQFTETPLRRFPPANWIELDSAFATTNATLSLAALNARAKGDLYMLTPPISLQSVVNFNITITYPAARALPSGFNARVGVFLNGYMLRAAQ